MKIITKEFWDDVVCKIVESLVSVKVVTIITFMITSTLLLVNGYIESSHWVGGNAGIISTVYALREGFKISKIREMDNNDDIKKMRE